MTDYTPPTEQVREIYAEIRHEGTRLGLDLHRAEFDRWLATVKADALQAVLDMHKPETPKKWVPVRCDHCRKTYPCPTVEAFQAAIGGSHE